MQMWKKNEEEIRSRRKNIVVYAAVSELELDRVHFPRRTTSCEHDVLARMQAQHLFRNQSLYFQSIPAYEVECTYLWPPFHGGAHPTPFVLPADLLFRNEDRAGAVLQVLQELEAAEVNVGRLNVGRQEVNEQNLHHGHTRRVSCMVFSARDPALRSKNKGCRVPTRQKVHGIWKSVAWRHVGNILKQAALRWKILTVGRLPLPDLVKQAHSQCTAAVLFCCVQKTTLTSCSLLVPPAHLFCL